MCSIAGGEGVHEMLEKMIHRSPDGIGVIDGIGMGRLAVIDLKSDGLCPFHEDGVTLAFNGEIFNYQRLTADLGLDCRTTSDTEVLFRVLKQFGVPGIGKLNGMFAFAYKDGEKIMLARDCAGEKPLYYTEAPFRFASENKALDFKGKEFPPGHYGIYKDGKLTIKRWWNFQPQVREIKDPEKELELLLEDSIRLRTQSDVPYGLFLSGGVDSTLISTFHDFDHTYTYEDGDYEKEFKEVFPKILYHLDGPPIRSFSPFGLWKLNEMAHKDGVKVVLSGEGADELFGGYVRYLPDALFRQATLENPSYSQMFKFTRDVNQAGWLEFNGNMRELLKMGDRMSAAFGIENRCPFLDRRIIEFAFSLTPEQKIDGFTLKKILRKVLLKRKPDYKEIEKQGLYVSVNKWLGSSDKYGKEAYSKYQEDIWKQYRQ